MRIVMPSGAHPKPVAYKEFATRTPPQQSITNFPLVYCFPATQSSIMIEDGTGAVVGEVHQRWHLWRRKYDLYLGKRQFAAIDGGLFAWDFVLRDHNGGVYSSPASRAGHS
jgi:Scramblase